MDFEQLKLKAAQFLENNEGNFVAAEDALFPELAGKKIFDAPLFGVADAADPVFDEFKKPGVIGEGFRKPCDWLPEGKRVVSWFLPFTDEVRRSNYPAICRDEASPLWLHARIEGQLMMDKFSLYVAQLLKSEGFSCVTPTAEEKVEMIAEYASNWSERHVAYAAGLGTFGLSRGLITEKGMAGRFGSLVTDAVLPVIERPYSSPFEYCIMCGKCQVNCPVNAIDAKRGVIDGKDQLVCGPFIRGSRRPACGPNQRVRYGCGKCQVDVPCMNGIPGRKL